MEIGAVIEIIAAVLAFVGIVCLAKYISEVFFLPREVQTAIRIFDDDSVENIDILLHIARKGMWRGIGRQTVVLVSDIYADNEKLLSVIKESGLEYYVIK